jgi:hypothetical protein
MSRLYLWFDMFYSLYTHWRWRRRYWRNQRRIHEDEEDVTHS